MSMQKIIDIPEQDDCFNDIRKEYSDMLKMQLSKGNNGLVKTNILHFPLRRIICEMQNPGWRELKPVY